MMTVFGIAGCLALYGAVRRITGFIVPGLVAATTLGFSSIYWTHSLAAEAYVFLRIVFADEYLYICKVSSGRKILVAVFDGAVRGRVCCRSRIGAVRYAGVCYCAVVRG